MRILLYVPLSKLVSSDRFEIFLADVSVLDSVAESTLGEKSLGSVSGRFVGRQEHDSILVAGIE